MKWIITGAAGFIGCNTIERLLARGDSIVGVDNLSRPGSRENLRWLLRRGGLFNFVECDIREAAAVDSVVAKHADADAVLHLAGQVAVTTSLSDPRSDFEINAMGTLNICEAMRKTAVAALLINASTNKVYGSQLGELALVNGRWTAPRFPHGVGEGQPIEFESPYACSKGAAEQYVIDYGRSFGLRTVSLRQSCIYGPRQFGIEDQGWLAWLCLAALTDNRFTIYGDGCQVRDVLYVDDLVDSYVACAERTDAVAGRVINVGGGPNNQLSIRDLITRVESRLGRSLVVAVADPRRGDQPFYVSDIRLAERLLGWEPRVSVNEGLERLLSWLEANLETVASVVGRAKSLKLVPAARH